MGMSGAIGATSETTLPVGQSIEPNTVPNIPVLASRHGFRNYSANLAMFAAILRALSTELLRDFASLSHHRHDQS